MNLRVFYLYKTVGFGWLRCFVPCQRGVVLLPQCGVVPSRRRRSSVTIAALLRRVCDALCFACLGVGGFASCCPSFCRGQ